MSGSRAVDLEAVNNLSDHLHRARDQAIWITMCGTGARVGELSRATVGDVLGGDRRMKSKLHIPSGATKGKRRAKNLPMPERVQRALILWLSEHPAPHQGAPLFPSQKDKSAALTPRQIQRLIKNAAEAAGVEGKITPHSARKFFGTTVYESSGHDINLTAKALGHTSIAATPAYLELGNERLEHHSLAVFDATHQKELSLSSPDDDASGTPGHAPLSSPTLKTPKNGDCTPWPSPSLETTLNS